MQVVGHGVRWRWLTWKFGWGNVIHKALIAVRRFRCLSCEVTITVLPCAVEPRRSFARDLIVWMLAAWSMDDLAAHELRALVDAEPQLDWPQLRRWAVALGQGRGPPKAQAMEVAQRAAGHAPPGSREGLTLTQRAFVGARYMR